MRNPFFGTRCVTAALALLAAFGPALATCVDYATTPKWLAALDTPGQALDLSVAGAFAYIADGPSGLRIHDITDPASPQLAGFLDTPGSAYDVVVSGNLAYVADGSSGLRIIDVSNPASPQLVGFVDTPGFAGGVTVVGTIAYVADGANGLQVINVANPASPLIVGTLDTPGYASAVAVSGSHAFIADGASGLRAIDVSNPASPQAAGSFDTPGNALKLAISGTHALVADGPSGLRVISIANPASPQSVGVVFAPWFVTSVAVSGQHAWVTDGPGGVLAIDVTNPAMPAITGSVGVLGTGIAIAGTTVHVAAGNLGHETIDATFRHSPAVIGKLDTPGLAQGVHVAGNHAYIADGDAGLRVIDITNPALPVFAGVVDTPGHAWAVAVAGSYAYVADQDAGLQVVDISNPASPQIVSTANTPGLAVDVAVIGPRAFVSDYDQGVQLVDISNPASPQLIASIGTPTGLHWGLDASQAAAIAAQPVNGSGIAALQGPGVGPFVYNVGYESGDRYLEVIDTGVAGHPVIGDLRILGADPLEVVWASGGRAFVLFADGDIDIIDVSDPTNPRYPEGVDLPRIDLPGISYGMGILGGSESQPAVAGGQAVAGVDHAYGYVANELGGVQVVSFANDMLELIGSINAGDARGVHVAPSPAGGDPLVYVANGTAGLAIVPTQCNATTAVGDRAPTAAPLQLAIFPNPGRMSGTIRFATTRSGPVRASIHDLGGREVREVFEGPMGPGEHALDWDRLDRTGRPIPPGIYLVKIQTTEGVATARYAALR